MPVFGFGLLFVVCLFVCILHPMRFILIIINYFAPSFYIVWVALAKAIILNIINLLKKFS